MDDSKWLDVRARIVNGSGEDVDVKVSTALTRVKGAKNASTATIPAAAIRARSLSPTG